MTAKTAFPSQKDITDKGNVIVETDPGSALGTRRRWKKDGFAQREAINTDVEKTSYNKTENKGKED
jgi:hypothetical protein